jgi:acetyltransferase
MIKAAIAFSTQEAPRGNRIGMITNTGGPGIQAVDESVSQGLELARWSPEGHQRLEESLYAEASLGNPVDVVATANADHYFTAVDTLLKEQETDMVLVFFVTAPFTDTDAIARRIKEATEGSDKPVVVVVETSSEFYGLIDKLRASDLPVYEFPEDGARALAAMRRYAVLRDRPVAEPSEIAADKAAADGIIGRFSGKDAYLPQHDAFKLLAAYGIPVPRIAEVKSAADLAAAAGEVGFPCVLKVDSAAVVHKSDEGGVALGIADQAGLEAAFKEMSERFSGHDDVTYVVQEQCAPATEVIVGATESPGLGSLVMFGLGGIFVEVMKDVVFGVAPLSQPEAQEMIEGIKGYPLLQGVRGQQGVDQAALAELLVRASHLAADYPDIVEMDLNPIFAGPDGATAVDVRIKVR